MGCGGAARDRDVAEGGEGFDDDREEREALASVQYICPPMQVKEEQQVKERGAELVSNGNVRCHINGDGR
jgi:hypothetical protein